jgi:hypothetical protein
MVQDLAILDLLFLQGLIFIFSVPRFSNIVKNQDYKFKYFCSCLQVSKYHHIKSIIAVKTREPVATVINIKGKPTLNHFKKLILFPYFKDMPAATTPALEPIGFHYPKIGSNGKCPP